jgi:tetratricopeptide (TPR) repeat protein
MKCTEPLPNSDWSENAEWVSLRKSVFKNLALYHQKKEDWNKALANFKHSLKLDQSPINPDVLGAANTSLTCAVILSKLNKYAESIDYAESCMKAIEDLA